jgi:hypothetical protein
LFQALKSSAYVVRERRRGLLAYAENTIPSYTGPQSKEDRTEGTPEGSSLGDLKRSWLTGAFSH